jgi:hypothetical protein
MSIDTQPLGPTQTRKAMLMAMPISIASAVVAAHSLLRPCRRLHVHHLRADLSIRRWDFVTCRRVGPLSAAM